MTIKTKLKIERFFKEQLWQIIIIVAFVIFCGFLFNRMIVAILFAISHTIVRMMFDKQYHANKTYICLVITLSVAFFGIGYCLPLSISLLSAIPMSYFISLVGYIAQDRIDIYFEFKDLELEFEKLCIELQKYKQVDLYQMTEDELRNYGASQKLSELQQDILIMRTKQHLKISEICRYRNYGRTTIKYHLSEIKKKLQLDYV